MGEVVKTSGGLWQHSPARSEWMWAELCVLEGARLSPRHWDGAGDVIQEQRRATGVCGGTEHGDRDTSLPAGCRTELLGHRRTCSSSW